MVPHLALMVVIIIFIFSLNILLSIVQSSLIGEITPQSVMFIIATTLFLMGLNLGFLHICINIINNKKVNFIQLFSSFHMLISYVMATAIYIMALIIVASPGIMLLMVPAKPDLINLSYASTMDSWLTILGIILIIVPSIYLSIRLQFYDYFLVDEECGALESIKKSAKISKGYVLELFILGAILALIVLISIIPFGIGLIISAPLSTMATSYIYLKLK